MFRCFAGRNAVSSLRFITQSGRSSVAKALGCSSDLHSSRLMANSEERTFQYQDSLPPLPVPRLDQTCDNYLESVKPHLTDKEFLQTEFLVNQFCTGIGKDLQRKLEKRAHTSRNWLKVWWEDNAYLKGRYPAAPLVNIGGEIDIRDFWPPMEGTQVERAAHYTHALLQIWKDIYRQKRKPEKLGSTTPLCMDQFSRLFTCCKIPGKEIDSIQAQFQPAPGDTPRHVIVHARGRIFSCCVLDNQLEPLPPPVIKRQLQQISDVTTSSPSQHAVCSLTAADRTTWFELRERLLSLHPNNKQSLDSIESSLFAIVLDDRSPVTANEVAAECVFGDCRNRWFDKAITVLFFKSGTLGLHCDHTPFDGIVPINESHAACALVKNSREIWNDDHDADEAFQPQELEFVVDNVIVKGMEETEQKYHAVAKTMNAIILQFKDFGKNVPKQHKVHPDTFVQLAIQLAYYKLHGRPAPTYETAHTRMFYHGRTETVRSCTMEALHWCKAMVDPNETHMKKTERFREAYSKHDRIVKDCTNGEGCDHHLLGLRLIAEEEGIPTPQIYLDKGWKASGGDGNFVLSTSCIGFAHSLGGCAAMVEDGYGLFYSIEDQSINFHIATYKTSRVTNGAAFEESLVHSLTSMAALLAGSKL